MVSDPGYDYFADEYDRVIFGGFREKIQDQIVFKALDDVIGEAPSRILDAGGGTGHYSLPYAEIGHQVVILDKSKKMLEKARQKAQTQNIQTNVILRFGDMQQIEAPDDSFEVVLYHLALCHVEKPEQALREFRRVLKSGGYLSLIVENREFFSIANAFRGKTRRAIKEWQETPLFIDFKNLGRLRTFSKTEITEMLSESGFSITAERGLRVVCD